MKNKKLIILLSILLLALIGVMANLIAAWLTDTDITGPTEFTVGDVTFAWSGSIVEDEYVVPGQELISASAPYALANSSTIATELRVWIIIKYAEEGDGAPLWSDGIGYVVFQLSEGWVLSESDGKYYYQGEDAIQDDTKYLIPISVESIAVLDNLKLDGSKVGNDFSGVLFHISLMFEAKQGDYVDWAQLGTAGIEFSTGLAPEN